MGNIRARFGIGSVWKWEHWKKVGSRNGAYAFNASWEETNVMTDEGITHVLDVVLSAGAQKTAWYISLFNDDYVPTIADTYQSPGYTETTNYSGARPTWQEAGVSAKVITNSANVASFTMSATETIFGGSLVSANTKGDTVSGEVLLCSTAFANDRGVENEDVLKVTATISGQDV